MNLLQIFRILLVITLLVGVFSWKGFRYYSLDWSAAIKLTAIPAIPTVLVGLLNLIIN